MAGLNSRVASFQSHVKHATDRLQAPRPRTWHTDENCWSHDRGARANCHCWSNCRILKSGQRDVSDPPDRSQYVDAQVVGFGSGTIFMMPLWEASGLHAGAKVFLVSDADTAMVCDHLLGRVVDALGEPLDGLRRSERPTPKPSGQADQSYAAQAIDRILDVGVKAINAMLTIGCGQRLGLIAGSGVGKSVLLGMLTKFTSADVVVIGLIGERGREVKEFIEQILGPEGMGHAVVVAAPADNSPLLRIRATNLAHLYAEYFRAQGKDVCYSWTVCPESPTRSARLVWLLVSHLHLKAILRRYLVCCPT